MLYVLENLIIEWICPLPCAARHRTLVVLEAKINQKSMLTGLIYIDYKLYLNLPAFAGFRRLVDVSAGYSETGNIKNILN